MSLKSLPPLLRDEPAMVDMISAGSAVVGVPEAATAFVLAGLSQLGERRPILAVTPTVADAETIAKNMRENRCFKSVNVGRTSVFAETKQKYQLEFELKCEEPKKKPKAAAEPEGSAQPAAGAPGSTKSDKTEGGNK